jgi:glutamine synthetase
VERRSTTNVGLPRTVRTRVEEILRAPAEASVAGILELLEDGYAHAMNMDADCRRMTHELAGLRVEASDPDRAERVRVTLWATREELRELRNSLSALRTWVERQA